MVIWPLSLIVLRVVLGPVALACASNGAPRVLFAPLVLAGMLSDILDGVVARRLGVARPWLRRLDSLADVTFYLCVLGATWVVARPVVEAGWLPLGLLLLSEVGCLTASLLRFGVLPANHCYSAKAYGLVPCLAFVGVLSFGAGAWAFYALSAVGLIANMEVLSILLLSQTAPVDVPSVFKLPRGRAPSVARAAPPAGH